MYTKCTLLALSACSSFLLIRSATGLSAPTQFATPFPTPTVPPSIAPKPPPLPVNPPVLGPSATIVLPTAAYAISRSVNGLFQRVGLSPDQVAQVTVQYPSTQSLQFVKAEAMDGGLVAVNIPGPLQTSTFGPFGGGVINANGVFTFTFKAGHTPGLYQVRLRQSDQVLALRFWVLDSMHPKNNPPAIAPTMTGGRQ